MAEQMKTLDTTQGWYRVMGGERVGAYVHFSNTAKENVSVEIIGWLDKNLNKTTKAKATYAQVKRWLFGEGDLPKIFAVSRDFWTDKNPWSQQAAS